MRLVGSYLGCHRLLPTTRSMALPLVMLPYVFPIQFWLGPRALPRIIPNCNMGPICLRCLFVMEHITVSPNSQLLSCIVAPMQAIVCRGAVIALGGVRGQRSCTLKTPRHQGIVHGVFMPLLELSASVRDLAWASMR